MNMIQFYPTKQQSPKAYFQQLKEALKEKNPTLSNIELNAQVLKTILEEEDFATDNRDDMEGMSFSPPRTT